MELLNQLHAILPEKAAMVFLGDGEFDRIELQAVLQSKNWRYVCRTAKNTQLFEEGRSFSFSDLYLQMDDQICLSEVWFTIESYGPVLVVAIREQGLAHPLYLVTNFELPDEANHWHKSAFISKPFSQTRKVADFPTLKPPF